jgi:hypothetical protein
MAGAFSPLAAARDRAPLPEEPANEAALEAWPLDLRRQLF